MDKKADAEGVPFAGTAATQASLAPIPPPAVDSKPAPGQTGPKGMAPRTNYSRVNSGASPPADVGASVQKSVVPDAQSFLPPKVAHSEVPMNVTNKMTLQQMVKAAASGVADHAAVLTEAERNAPATKLASAAAPQDDSVSTEYAEKLASAVEYLLKEATAGEGPNHLEVTEAPGGKNPFTPGGQGHATPASLPPKNPGTFKPSETPTGPATALQTSDAVPGKQKLAMPSVAELRAVVKTAKKEEPAKEMCEGCGKEKSACTCSKTAAATETLGTVNPALVDAFLGHIKQAEDAINPAHIAAGAAVPPETSEAGQPGGAPAGGKPQGATNLVATNEAAINYTRGQAKAGPKADVNKILTEPALSSAHDNVLQKAFAHTGEAGTKMASLRSSAARAVIEKMASEAAEEDESAKKKKKESAGFSAPPVGGAAGAASGAM